MLHLLIAAQLAAPLAVLAPNYSSLSVQELVAHVSAGNRLPSSLSAYSVNTETELSWIFHDTTAREIAPAVEQIAALARWDRANGLGMHAVGYRASPQFPFFLLDESRAVSGWGVPQSGGGHFAFMASLFRGSHLESELRPTGSPWARAA